MTAIKHFTSRTWGWRADGLVGLHHDGVARVGAAGLLVASILGFGRSCSLGLSLQSSLSPVSSPSELRSNDEGLVCRDARG